MRAFRLQNFSSSARVVTCGGAAALEVFGAIPPGLQEGAGDVHRQSADSVADAATGGKAGQECQLTMVSVTRRAVALSRRLPLIVKVLGVAAAYQVIFRCWNEAAWQ